MEHDPRHLGAACDACPLGPNGCLRDAPWQPVPSEYHHDPAGNPMDRGAVVIGHPSATDVRLEYPFSDRDGGAWAEAIESAGSHRTEFAIIPSVACAPPEAGKGGAWLRMMKRLDKINKDRVSAGQAPWPSPSECCRPRLFAEIDGFENIIVLGGKALRAVTGSTQSVTKARGGFFEYTEDWQRVLRDNETGAPQIGGIEVSTSAIGRKVFPTFDPGFIAKSPGYQFMWRSDLGKALRWYEDRLTWVPPDMLLYPTAAQYERWLADNDGLPFYSIDVETQRGYSFLWVYMYTFAIATPDLDAAGNAALPGEPFTRLSQSVGVELMTPDMQPHYAPDEEEEIFALTRWFVSSEDRHKFGSNMGVVERMVFERFGSETGTPITWPTRGVLPWRPAPARICEVRGFSDSLLVGRAEQPEVMKGLKTRATYHLDVGHWEGDSEEGGAAWESQDGRRKLVYNCLHRDQHVVMADGSRPTIREVVQQKMTGPILAWDGERVVESAILAWHLTHNEGQPWIRINSRMPGTITVTPDHELYVLGRGWVRADAISEGDYLLSDEPALSPHIWSALRGTLIGDSTLNTGPATRKKRAYRAELYGGHTGELAREKAAWFGGLLELTDTIVTNSFNSEPSALTEYRMRSRYEFGDIYTDLFSNGRCVPAEWIEAFDAISWAWWYMDDGCLANEKQPRIAMCRYSEEDIERVRGLLRDRYGWETSVYGDKHPSIAFLGDGRYGFQTMIAPYVLPSQRYKLSPWVESASPFAGYPEAPPLTDSPTWRRVHRVESYRPERSNLRHEGRWCVTTDHGCFFTTGGLVSNCNDVVTGARMARPMTAAAAAKGYFDEIQLRERGRLT